MSGEPIKPNAKKQVDPTLIKEAKACFDGTLGSGIHYTDGRPSPAPSQHEKRLCAASVIENAAKKLSGAGLTGDELDVLVDAAEAKFTPKGKAKPASGNHR